MFNGAEAMCSSVEPPEPFCVAMTGQAQLS